MKKKEVAIDNGIMKLMLVKKPLEAVHSSDVKRRTANGSSGDRSRREVPFETRAAKKKDREAYEGTRFAKL